jgi:hypothetical protein
VRTKHDVIVHDYESQMFITISEDCAAAMQSQPEVQIFPKQLKHLTKLQYVETQKQ